MSTVFQRSSLTLANAKQFIAEQGGKAQTTEMLDRAGRSLQSAIQDWNKYNWGWLLSTASVAIATSGTGSLPYDFKDVYTLRWSGSNAKWIPARTRRAYDRTVWNQAATSLEPTFYDLFYHGSVGQISVIGAAATGTADLKYYRKMTEPCSTTFASARTGPVSDSTNAYLFSTALSTFANAKIGNVIAPNSGWATANVVNTVTAIKQAVDPTGVAGYGTLVYLDAVVTATGTAVSGTIGGDNHYLDIPSAYEWDILAQAVVHFLIGIGAPRDKVIEWKDRAAAGFEKALMDDREQEDLDIAFQPSPDYPHKWWNPNAVYD